MTQRRRFEARPSAAMTLAEVAAALASSMAPTTLRMRLAPAHLGVWRPTGSKRLVALYDAERVAELLERPPAARAKEPAGRRRKRQRSGAIALQYGLPEGWCLASDLAASHGRTGGALRRMAERWSADARATKARLGVGTIEALRCLFEAVSVEHDLELEPPRKVVVSGRAVWACSASAHRRVLARRVFDLRRELRELARAIAARWAPLDATEPERAAMAAYVERELEAAPSRAESPAAADVVRALLGGVGGAWLACEEHAEERRTEAARADRAARDARLDAEVDRALVVTLEALSRDTLRPDELRARRDAWRAEALVDDPRPARWLERVVLALAGEPYASSERWRVALARTGRPGALEDHVVDFASTRAETGLARATPALRRALIEHAGEALAADLLRRRPRRAAAVRRRLVDAIRRRETTGHAPTDAELESLARDEDGAADARERD